MEKIYDELEKGDPLIDYIGVIGINECTISEMIANGLSNDDIFEEIKRRSP